MIDRHLLPVQNAVLAPMAYALVVRGAEADRLTLLGFGAGALAATCLALGWEWSGLLLILMNRILDGLDGEVARLNGPSDRGAFLDMTCDFLFYALVPLGFALADPGQNALAAAVLIASFVGTGSSFLAFAAIAAKRGLSTDAYRMKGVYYIGGLTEGAETVAVFVAMCLWPGQFAPLAYGFSALCLITTLTRWRMGWQMFGGGPTS